MATLTFVPLEVYLRSSEYEPDAEYVDGVIEERPAGELSHADWQSAICAWFCNHLREWNIRCLPALRVRVAPTRFRIPDVTVLNRSLPVEQIITQPPIAVFEVLSPEDTVFRLKRKLADYEKMGIPQIWVVDPETGSFERYQAGSLRLETRFEQESIRFNLPEIAALLQA